MTEYVTLMGAEQVQSAGSRIASAAEDIRRAAGSLNDYFCRHESFLNEWLGRFEAALSSHEDRMREIAILKRGEKP